MTTGQYVLAHIGSLSFGGQIVMTVSNRAFNSDRITYRHTVQLPCDMLIEVDDEACTPPVSMSQARQTD